MTSEGFLWLHNMLGLFIQALTIVKSGQESSSNLINIYHFHISDQRVKPVHISYIASLVLEC